MSPRRAVLSCWCATALWGPAALRAQSQPADESRAGLIRLVTSVQDADYRGDLVRLRALADSMQSFTLSRDLSGRARYWRGFAYWRHALNSLNDGADEESVDRDFAAAIAEFRQALARDSADLESRIGLAAGLGNRAYFNRRVPERRSGFLAELRPLLVQIRSEGPDNPRMMFVVSANLFWAPQDRGGDRQAALEMLQRGIRLSSSRPAGPDPLAPSWGEAELHMLLGWFSLNLDPPDLASAVGHAEAALLLRPQWRYVRDRLLPQVRSRTGRPEITTVAYRVHRMPEMLAFYRDAFGVEFSAAEVGPGLEARRGGLGGLTLLFVPIREDVDFEGFPVHQLGIQVPDVDTVLAAARRHGGRVQDAPHRMEGRLTASLRDPDGNTLEVYGQ